MRLNKYLAAHGVASRRAADELISAGKVLVNGSPAELGQQVSDSDVITAKGKNLSAPPSLVYYLLHKPTGVVSTTTDPQGRRTVLDLLPVKERLYPVGRLDYDSEGLILLTNDGELTYRLTHPKFAVEKVYKVLVKGKPSTSTISKLETGVVIEGKKTAPALVKILEAQDKQTWLEFTLHEGRNRQVRKMCQAVKLPVVRLIRLKLGPYELGDLKPGQWQEAKNLL